MVYRVDAEITLTGEGDASALAEILRALSSIPIDVLRKTGRRAEVQFNVPGLERICCPDFESWLEQRRHLKARGYTDRSIAVLLGPPPPPANVTTDVPCLTASRKARK